ncbi:MAG: hypothetical protein HLUCCA09_02605 [Rhodobacteraceae bacterium HLUCCA09]|nr:MAG: hypothetical protein HLUCCA09_02605 [Rhodobacteraceae bacterium HLUCCA09]
MRTFLVLLLLLPHLAVFVYAGVREWRAWREIDPDARPTFLSYLGREQGPTEQLAPQRSADWLIREAERHGKG